MWSPNSLIYFDDLLSMSLNVKHYKIAGRGFLTQMLSNFEDFDCKYCCRIRILKFELERSDFEIFNKNVKWWRITENSGEDIIVTRGVESEED